MVQQALVVHWAVQGGKRERCRCQGQIERQSLGACEVDQLLLGKGPAVGHKKGDIGQLGVELDSSSLALAFSHLTSPLPRALLTASTISAWVTRPLSDTSMYCGTAETFAAAAAATSTT